MACITVISHNFIRKTIMFDDETIRLIWRVFIGIVGLAFALTEGFDVGAATCSLSSAERMSSAW
jgi:cytochrome bd-type quinol oxidase subunit 2